MQLQEKQLEMQIQVKPKALQFVGRPIPKCPAVPEHYHWESVTLTNEKKPLWGTANRSSHILL